MPKFTTDHLFRVYIRALQRARQGTVKFDEARLNRALGLSLLPDAQRTAALGKYGATATQCGCPDASAAVMFCKHRLCCWLLLRAAEEAERVGENVEYVLTAAGWDVRPVQGHNPRVLANEAVR